MSKERLREFAESIFRLEEDEGEDKVINSGGQSQNSP